MSRKATVPEKDVLEQEYSEFGATVSSIARKHGVSNPTVHKWLTSYGIERKDHLQASREANSLTVGTTRVKRDADYLAESSLGTVLKGLFPVEEIVHDRPFPGHAFRPDYLLPKVRLAVEFDGFRHYQSYSVQCSDDRKDRVLGDSGYTIVRFPYFVQPTPRVLDHLLGRSHHLGWSYPHGFVDPKALLPCDFNETGLVRYRRFLTGLWEGGLDDVADEIVNSAQAGKARFENHRS